jgi:intein-encoded DNA endonuclease-like protein
VAERNPASGVLGVLLILTVNSSPASVETTASVNVPPTSTESLNNVLQHVVVDRGGLEPQYFHRGLSLKHRVYMRNFRIKMPPVRSNLPADFRLQLYREAMQLRAEHGWGYRRIAKALSAVHGIGVPKGTVSNWLLGAYNPVSRLHRFFQAVPSPELSYVIGAVLGDGYTTEDQGNGIVGFTNKDRYLLEHFLTCLSRIFNTQNAGRITRGTRYGVFKATIGSRLLALFFQRPLVEIAPFIEEHPAPFVRGFFDAEGHATITVSRGRLSARVGASNTDVGILQYISALLRNKFGISSCITVGRRPLPTVIRGRSVNFRKTVY